MKFSKTYEPNQFEPDIYALWESSDAFRPSGDKTAEPYSIVMPPPNANGNLHIGHGLVNALQDILIRYHRLKGFNTWYIPGADHAGFETWVVYEKQLEGAGKSRFDFTRDELYHQVWDFVHQQRGNMELQLRALGASCDWSSLTFTLDPKVIDQVYQTFHQMWDDGLIYRGKRPVNYCTKHQTSFADIEIVHKDQKTPLYYMQYGPFVLATTRPETKFGDTAVAVHPDDERYQQYIGKTIKVEGVNGQFEVKVIADTMVDRNFGTGVVKITPAHDFNDWEVKERHNLPVVQVINQDGKMNDLAGRFKGMTVLEARQAVVAALKEKGLLVKVDKNYKTRVSYCYKCGTIIEPMLMEQWFVHTKPLAARAIKALEQGDIKFYPASRKKVLINYFKNLKDWNISRQAPWGIPIPAFHDGAGNWIFDPRVNQQQIEVDGKTYTRDEDTFDTWFSSGQWPFIVTNHLADPKTAFYPLSVMETAGEILFAWVARMLMMGLYVTGEIPFKDVYLHGLVLDDKGQKMSKSKGNVINPMEIISQYGSDAFRLGIVSSRSAGVNQAFSTSKIIASRNLCNKLWNIARFVQQLIDEGGEGAFAERSFSPVKKSDLPSSENLSERSESFSELDAEKTFLQTRVKDGSAKLSFTTLNSGEDWICRELNDCRAQLDKLIGKYRFAEAADLLYETIWNKYADWFLESQKIYKNTPLLKITLENILIMLHPFAPFVTETIWQTLSWTSGLLITQNWPDKLKFDPMTAQEFETLTTIISTVRNHVQSLPGGNKPILLFGQDSLVNDNQVLIQFLTHVSSVIPTDTPRGMRIALENREIYLDIDTETLQKYKQNLEDNILKLGEQINTLEARLRNPSYAKKAPKELVEETEQQLAEKQTTLDRLKNQLTLI